MCDRAPSRLRSVRPLLSTVAPCGYPKSFAREFGSYAGAFRNAVLSEPRGRDSERRQQAARLGLEIGDHVSTLAPLDVALILAVFWRATGTVDVIDRLLTA
jgi:hypothetical protein